MKIAYVTTYDIFNQATWPSHQLGICQAGYSITSTLAEQGASLDYTGALQKKFSLLTRLKWSLYRSLFKKDYYRWAEPLVVRDYAYQVAQKLSQSNSDIVLCTENAIPIAYLKSNQPIVLWSDATLNSLIDFYPYLSNLCGETIRNIYAIEMAALNNCKLAIYASDWAAQNAINTYKIDPNKVKVVPWGANIACNRTIDDIRSIVEFRASERCKLLFFGVDWFRKGGNIALEVAKELNARGLKTELIVVGCKPIANEPLPDFIKSVGYIDKSSPEGREKINHLLASSHFLILPSKAECYGHVFCEANSFGVPCLATDVGGIPTVIKEELNGKTFSNNALVSDYCNYIADLMNNYEQYKALALSSFNEYQSRLNWSVACQTAKNLMMEII